MIDCIDLFTLFSPYENRDEELERIYDIAYRQVYREYVEFNDDTSSALFSRDVSNEFFRSIDAKCVYDDSIGNSRVEIFENDTQRFLSVTNTAGNYHFVYLINRDNERLNEFLEYHDLKFFEGGEKDE